MARTKFGAMIAVLVFLMCHSNVLSGLQITSVAFSPDGTQLAVAGGTSLCYPDQADVKDSDIHILDAANGKLVKTVGKTTFTTNSVDWSPDGMRVVSSNDEGTAIVWDAATGEEVSRYSGSGYGVRSLFGAAWSSVDERIVVLGGGKDAVIWDAKTGDLVSRVDSSGTIGVMFAAWSSDGVKMAIGTRMDKVEIYDVDPSIEKPPLLLRIDSGLMTNLTWSPDGTQIATTSGKEVRIFDAVTGELTQTLKDSTNDLWAVAWTAIGNRIAAGGSDYKVRVWDVATGEQSAVFDHEAMVTSVDWSPDGHYLAFGGWQNPAKKCFEIVEVPPPDQ
jgi:WD40 repeat protein